MKKNPSKTQLSDELLRAFGFEVTTNKHTGKLFITMVNSYCNVLEIEGRPSPKKLIKLVMEAAYSEGRIDKMCEIMRETDMSEKYEVVPIVVGDEVTWNNPLGRNQIYKVMEFYTEDPKNLIRVANTNGRQCSFVGNIGEFTLKKKTAKKSCPFKVGDNIVRMDFFSPIYTVRCVDENRIMINETETNKPSFWDDCDLFKLVDPM